MHYYPYENEFNLHMNGISFSCERICIKTNIRKEAKGTSNSEQLYLAKETTNESQLSNYCLNLYTVAKMYSLLDCCAETTTP